MWASDSVEIAGHGGRSIYNRFYRHQSESDKLTVIVAGFAYTIESPYIFYSKHVPWDAGHDVLTIDFEYGRTKEFMIVGDDERERWFVEDVDAVGALLHDRFADRRLVLIGKSLGTSAVYRLCNDPTLSERVEGCVWLTPSERRHQIVDLSVANPRPSLFVYGDQDRYVRDIDGERLAKASHVESLVVRNGDHALETDSVENSLLYLRDYVTVLRRFFG